MSWRIGVFIRAGLSNGCSQRFNRFSMSSIGPIPPAAVSALQPLCALSAFYDLPDFIASAGFPTAACVMPVPGGCVGIEPRLSANAYPTMRTSKKSRYGAGHARARQVVCVGPTWK